MFHEKTPRNVKHKTKIIDSLENRIKNLPERDSILHFESTKLKK